MANVSNTIDLIRKFQHVLPRSSLVTIYKAFIRSYLDYGDMFDQAFKNSFHQKIESVQYDVAITIT